MQGFELPLLAPGSPEAEVELRVQSSAAARLFGGAEPWFDVKLIAGGEPYHGAIATQPLSCLQAVEQGRRTALMCQGGVLALQREGDEIQIDFHNAGGSHLHAAASAKAFEALIEQLLKG